MLYFADAIDVALAPMIGRVNNRIKTEYSEVLEVTPSYTSILVELAGCDNSFDQWGESLLDIAREEIQRMFSDEQNSVGKLIELPVYYHPEVGPDLEAVAAHAGLSVDQVVAIHSGCDYTVCAIGFAPGFAFLADVDERIVMPRHSRPRAKVAAGSVGIAERQTAVYPNDTPGGWNLLGRCPVKLYHPQVTPVSPFEVGDRVRFYPIDRNDYLERGGLVG